MVVILTRKIITIGGSKGVTLPPSKTKGKKTVTIAVFDDEDASLLRKIVDD